MLYSNTLVKENNNRSIFLGFIFIYNMDIINLGWQLYLTAVGRNEENIYEVNEETNGKKISEPVVRTEKCNI